MTLSTQMQKVRANPLAAKNLLVSLLRGRLVSLRIKIQKPRVQIGARFRAMSDLHIEGPGKVIIGNDVSVALNFLRIPSIITHLPESCVIIGDNTILGGTRISCVSRIEIGRGCLFGSGTIIDSDIIPSPHTRIDQLWQERHVKPIRIGNLFWAGTNSCILKGTEVGDECVLGAGGMIYDQQFSERSLLLGNPARRIGVTRC